MVFSFKYYKPGQLGTDVSCKQQTSPEAVICMSTGGVKFDKLLEPFPQVNVCRIRPFQYITWDDYDLLTPLPQRQK